MIWLTLGNDFLNSLILKLEQVNNLNNCMSIKNNAVPVVDDQFLIAFLRGTKFSLERTKEKLDMHYTLKTITPELYAKRDPFAPEVQKILKLG